MTNYKIFWIVLVIIFLGAVSVYVFRGTTTDVTEEEKQKLKQEECLNSINEFGYYNDFELGQEMYSLEECRATYPDFSDKKNQN